MKKNDWQQQPCTIFGIVQYDYMLDEHHSSAYSVKIDVSEPIVHAELYCLHELKTTLDAAGLGVKKILEYFELSF